jgi:hypothetical protein
MVSCSAEGVYGKLWAQLKVCVYIGNLSGICFAFNYHVNKCTLQILFSNITLHCKTFGKLHYSCKRTLQNLFLFHKCIQRIFLYNV